MFSHSVVVKMFSNMVLWFSLQFDNSLIIREFLKEKDNVATVNHSFPYKIYNGFRNFLSNAFIFLKFNKVLDGSIFKISFLWCSLAVILAPIMPTKIIIVLAIASFLSLLLELGYNRKKELQYFAINKYIIFYAIIYFVSIFTSVTVKGSLFGGLLMVMFMLIYFVVINSIETKKQLDIVMFFFICAGIVVSLYGFYQYIFPDKYSGVWHDKDLFESISFRVYSTLENPNVLGEYFLLIIPIGFAYFINTKNIIAKLFYIGATGVMMLCLMLTLSRGCYIGILVSMCLFLVLYDKRFIILAIIGLMLLPIIMPQTVIDRFLSIGNMADSSTSYRVYIYMGTLAMLKDYWLCGIGPGEAAFNLVYPTYAYNGISAPHSHNLFLQIITDVGIFGLIIFVSIIYQYYKLAFRTILEEKNKHCRTLTIAGCCSVTGFFIQSLFDYTFYNYRVMFLFWIVLGFSVLFTKFGTLEKQGGIL